jgi:hypothetical protein
MCSFEQGGISVTSAITDSNGQFTITFSAMRSGAKAVAFTITDDLETTLFFNIEPVVDCANSYYGLVNQDTLICGGLPAEFQVTVLDLLAQPIESFLVFGQSIFTGSQPSIIPYAALTNPSGQAQMLFSESEAGEYNISAQFGTCSIYALVDWYWGVDCPSSFILDPIQGLNLDSAAELDVQAFFSTSSGASYATGNYGLISGYDPVDGNSSLVEIGGGLLITDLEYTDGEPLIQTITVAIISAAPPCSMSVTVTYTTISV